MQKLISRKYLDKYLLLYFRAFPGDFETFFRMIYLGFDKDTLYDTSPSYIFSYNPWSSFHPIQKKVDSEEELPKEKVSRKNRKYFNEFSKKYKGEFEEYKRELTPYTIPLEPVHKRMYDILYEVQKVVPDSIYYDKMLSLGIGGFWDADDIGFIKVHSMVLLYEDLELAVNILDKKTDDEIASFWFFLYDGPHPKNYQEAYNKTYEQLQALNPRVAALMKKAYAHLLAQEHCPGH